ncbi:MAG TPA: nuclear transport factor 2 family protein [Myxococcota bacterium]|jgi:ketosteroid isomerase-like protein
MTGKTQLTGVAASTSVKPSAADAKADAAQVASSFYQAFARGDRTAMDAAYDPSVHFHDPLFGSLSGKHEVMEMWNTVIPAANPKTSHIEPTVQPNPTVRPDGSVEVKVHWDAHYDLGPRHVDNHSDTTLVIKNGKIIDQRDDWDLSAWTKQALPLGIGGNTLTNALTAFAAHAFVEVKDVFDR